MPSTGTETAAAHGYVIRGGGAGKRRLELLGRSLWPTTCQILKRTGFSESMTCLDLGCGGGDVTIGIARMAGPAGRVVGIDLDGVKLQAASEEAARQGLRIEFRQANIDEWAEQAVYDRIYTRFLLTHLPNPLAAVERMRCALRSGGLLVVEDIDFSGSFCHPPSPAFERYQQLYRAVVRKRGADADIGPKLHSLLTQAGLLDVKIDLVQPFHVDGEAKEVALVTLVNIADAVIAEGLATASELDAVVDELDKYTRRTDTILSFPRVFQAWGRRA